MTTATIHQNPITLIVPIIPSKIEDLRTRLRELKEDLLHKKHLEFESIGTIHFARWVIIDDVDEEGNPDHEKAKLVFTSNFDGTKEDQIRDLCTNAPHILDSIYQYCFGYPVSSERTTERRYGYLLSHNIPASSFYRGSPNRSLKQILGESKLRNFLRTELDSRSWKGISAKQVHKILVDTVQSRPEFEWAREPFEMPKVSWVGMVLLVSILLLLSPFIIALLLVVQWGYERNDESFKLTRSELNEKEILKLESYEDLGYQNQFTQLVVMKPGKVRLVTFKLLMLFSRVLIKLKFVEGKLMGIPSIHFARWVLFDNNKRVLFFSNFDGSWQQYLGDFIDKSGWGLTSIFSNTTCFPKTRYLFWGGAYDEEHFLAWSRNTELQTQVWYNAYPELGIKNVNNNSRIRSELFKNLSEKKAADFLKILKGSIMEQLDLKEIQAYLMHDYEHMFYSRFVLLQVTDAPSAKQWISDISHQLTYATSLSTLQSEDTLLNIAVTASGFKALGMHSENVTAFSREFREGMISDHRTRMLGDADGSSPDLWLWGNDKKNFDEPVHILLLVFGKDEATCIRFYDDLKENFSTRGLKESIHIDGRILKDSKEHFGFKDGISQPIIKGSGQTGPESNMIEAGEFVLGYKNVYDVLPQTPLIMKDQGDLNLLPPDAGGSGKKDLGRNGTYLVVRQLEQNVNAFWSFMNKKTQNEDGSVNVDESLKLSAKIMGRWPSGAPITTFPDADPGILMEVNDFGYAKLDKDGLKCPFGSHIRRNNPRDSFEDLGIQQSYKLSNRHRIIRRARLYGEPFIGSPENHTPEGEVGMLFNCFNADISRQFEFLQYTWANIPKTKELYNDPDPLIGVKEIPVEGLAQNFTIQDSPVNRTISGLERFIKVKGGAYFFFPSFSALRYTASI